MFKNINKAHNKNILYINNKHLKLRNDYFTIPIKNKINEWGFSR